VASEAQLVYQAAEAVEVVIMLVIPAVLVIPLEVVREVVVPVKVAMVTMHQVLTLAVMVQLELLYLA
jgi:hypothetical protein